MIGTEISGLKVRKDFELFKLFRKAIVCLQNVIHSMLLFLTFIRCETSSFSNGTNYQHVLTNG